MATAGKLAMLMSLATVTALQHATSAMPNPTLLPRLSFLDGQDRSTPVTSKRIHVVRRSRIPLASTASTVAGTDQFKVEKTWTWDDHKCRYVVVNSADVSSTISPCAAVLIHGFAGSADNSWRAVLPALGETRQTYALDLLGLGLSDKPADAPYSIALWQRQISDFCREVVGDVPVVLVGTSFGSLIALSVAADSESSVDVRGICMLNCAVGMNNKNGPAAARAAGERYPEWQLRVFEAVLALIDWLFGQKAVLRAVFARLATAENVRTLLEGIYVNDERVDDELVAAYLEPAATDTAVDVFGAIYTGDAGPLPNPLVTSLLGKLPLLAVWGTRDTITPIDGPVGAFLQELAENSTPELLQFEIVETGHVPHDDAPEKVNAIMSAWMGRIDEWRQ